MLIANGRQGGQFVQRIFSESGQTRKSGTASMMSVKPSRTGSRRAAVALPLGAMTGSRDAGGEAVHSNKKTFCSIEVNGVLALAAQLVLPLVMA